eukprot:625366-Amphidinium_carterae.2
MAGQVDQPQNHIKNVDGTKTQKPHKHLENSKPSETHAKLKATKTTQNFETSGRVHNFNDSTCSALPHQSPRSSSSLGSAIVPHHTCNTRSTRQYQHLSTPHAWQSPADKGVKTPSPAGLCYALTTQTPQQPQRPRATHLLEPARVSQLPERKVCLPTCTSSEWQNFAYRMIYVTACPHTFESVGQRAAHNWSAHIASMKRVHAPSVVDAKTTNHLRQTRPLWPKDPEGAEDAMCTASGRQDPRPKRAAEDPSGAEDAVSTAKGRKDPRPKGQHKTP